MQNPLRRRFWQNHRRILEENHGISANTNAAIEMATGDFIVFADHDDILSAMTLTGKEIKWSGNALNDTET